MSVFHKLTNFFIMFFLYIIEIISIKIVKCIIVIFNK